MNKLFDFANATIVTAMATIAVLAIGAAGMPIRDGHDVYNSSCASCHGIDGRGRAQAQVGFDTPLPDFTDCIFASREADGDWATIVHEGGPIRSFSRLMPAFGDALGEDEIEAAIAHIRTFCKDPRWPRGEFNFPRGLFTEKAFPEDEAMWTTLFNLSGPTGINSELKYEKRFGPRGQLEVGVPLAVARSQVGLGDIAVAWKQNVMADVAAGTIVSLGGEFVLPTGDEKKDLGGGTTVFEPFLLFGQVLPNDMFFQGQVFAEFPFRSGHNDELGWRSAVGRTWASNMGFGTSWTPMLEVLGARELVGGAELEWDLVPQIQVSLSHRQHILLNLGVRLPVTQTSERDTQFGIYIIWDWFDGGLTEAWH